MAKRGIDKRKRKSRREKGVLWIAYKDGLPSAVADSALELSYITGVNVSTIRSNYWKYLHGVTQDPKYMKVQLEEDNND